jgi:hypothetical protein
MKHLLGLKLGALALVAMVTTAPNAYAFCGVTEATGTAKSAIRASNLAQRELRKEARKLRRQYGRKLVLEQPAIACKGGAIAIDANGNEIIGNASCTATQGFCVNP